MTNDDGDAADQPAQRLTERAGRSTAEQLERRVERGDRLAVGELEREAAPDEQAAQGHDERGDADVRDDEALQAADGAAEGEPDQQRDDPGVRLVEAETERVGDPLGPAAAP